MDAALRHSGGGAVCGRNNGVSILVLVDAALRHKEGRESHTYNSVSILVLVDAALRQRYVLGLLVTIFVSILVLVDAALRPRGCSGWMGSRTTCFNPCFSGCRPATAI